MFFTKTIRRHYEKKQAKLDDIAARLDKAESDEDKEEIRKEARAMQHSSRIGLSSLGIGVIVIIVIMVMVIWLMK